MTENERQAFIDQFPHDSMETIVGFAVMGGIFGESIDLSGNRLTGAAIVGVGLPGISLERELIKQYYTSRERGFEYAYQYPGINRVLQAAGRVIRSEIDRGIILLVDDRFAKTGYVDLLPDHWKPVMVDTGQDIRDQLEAFWNE